MRAFNRSVEALRDWAPLPIRLIVGYGFMAHGFAKLTRGPDTFAVMLHTLGVPLPEIAAWATTAIEILGGAAVFIGLLIPIASIPMAVVLLTALFNVHLPYGFFSVKLAQVTESGTKFGPVGYQILLLYLGGLTTLSLSGPGRLSLDRWLEKSRLRNALFSPRTG
ncbi:putative oxidoreductase [Bradyrhizobium sp. AZCC 1577]|uniref:DoxX family protein n=1 Tax=Bradyrhizobium sp. AZCC 1577 TaxID=3117019 RepID=UPI002FEED50C